MPNTLVRLKDGRTVSFPEGTSVAAARKMLQDKGYTPETIADTGDEFSFFDKFGYAFGETKNDVQKVGAWLQSHFPNKLLDDNIYKSVAERDWFYNTANPEERLRFIRQSDEQQAVANNPRLAEALASGETTLGAAGVLGSMTKELLSPTSLLPLGAGYKTAAIGGALLGAEWEVLDKMYQQERLTASGLATSVGLGAVAAPATKLLASKAPAVYKAAKRRSPSYKKNADNMMAYYQDQVTINLANSGVTDQAFANPQVRDQVLNAVHQKALQDIGMDQADFLTYHKYANAQPVTPSSISQAQALLEVAKEGVSLRTPGSKRIGLMGQLVGNMSRQLEQQHPRLGQTLRNFERRLSEENAFYMNRVHDFVEMSEKAGKQFGSRFYGAWNRNDEASILTMLEQVSDPKAARKALNDWRSVRKDLASMRQIIDPEFKVSKDYFPTEVTNYAEMAHQLRFIRKDGDYTRARELYAKRYDIKHFSPDDEKNFYNAYFSGRLFDSSFGKAGASKSRTILRDWITDDMAERFYNNNIRDVIIKNISRGVHDFNKGKMFGKGTARSKLQMAGGPDEHIENIIEDLMQTPEWKSLSGPDLNIRMHNTRELLKARFNANITSPHAALQAIRTLGYISTLPNPVTALVQLADFGVSAFDTTVKDTLNAIFAKRGAGYVRMEDIGVGKHIMQELSESGGDTWNQRLSSVLDKTLKISGFGWMDRLGKEVNINAALNHAKRIATAAPNSKAAIEFEKKWKPRFGKDYGLLLDDLRNNRMSGNVKDFLFSSLADKQPISQLEMPMAYAMHPDARMLYTLKSYMLKHLNYLGSEILDRHETPAATARKIGRYLLTAGVAGLSVNEARTLLMGEKVAPEDLPTDFALNLAKLVGISKYTGRSFQSDGVAGVAADMVAPPMGYFMDLYNDVSDIATGKVDLSEMVPPEGVPKVIRNLPLGGNIIYNFFGGGLEKRAEASGRDTWL